MGYLSFVGQFAAVCELESPECTLLGALCHQRSISYMGTAAYLHVRMASLQAAACNISSCFRPAGGVRPLPRADKCARTISGGPVVKTGISAAPRRAASSAASRAC